MPLFMDFHKIDNITIDDVKKAHIADLSVQEQYGVKYHQFWVNEKAGFIFCLTEGPDKQTCELVHKMAHGNMACALTEVEPGFYKTFMGDAHKIESDMTVHADGSIDDGYRTIMVTSVRGMARASNGSDINFLEVSESAKDTVGKKIFEFHGRNLPWTADDSQTAVFTRATDAVNCAIEINKSLSALAENDRPRFRIGISADQPVNEAGAFFANGLKFAHQLSNAAENQEILISSLVKKICDNRLKESPSLRCLDITAEKFLSQLVDYSHEYFSTPDFTLDHLCKDIGISRPQLYRKVTAITHRSPNDFLRDLRLEKAFTLLQERSGNVTQVSLSVGYSNPSYFAKCFIEKFGFAPSAIKK
jgi:AraC-like DNA-binding protein